MYLKRILFENSGPISELDLSLDTNSDTIRPCVFVGENGSGKSIVLSSIADALIEFADKGYDNATIKNGLYHKYFKNISGRQIKLGSAYMVSFLEFIHDKGTINYIVKTGHVDCVEFKKRHHIVDDNGKISWDGKNYKENNITQDIARDIYDKTVVCYFPPSRFEKPSWLGEDYNREVGLSLFEKFDGELYNSIIVNNTIDELMQWIQDVVADSRCDHVIEFRGDSLNPVIRDYNRTNHTFLSLERANVEKIMSVILDQEVHFTMGHRGLGKNRLRICASTGNALVPSFDSLSTGQMALFVLFSTIARYADRLDVNNSRVLENITGIVVIDEIELHLHSNMQREILPKLMKLFPKIQFIVSTHSPLFLLGLKEQYGDNLELIELPNGNSIAVEQFSEFDKAYSYYASSERYKRDVSEAIRNSESDKPLIITEGSTDWKHMKAAFQELQKNEQYSWLSSMEFDFLEFEPLNRKGDENTKLQMSCSELYQMAKDFSKIPQKRRYIFIVDNDTKDSSKMTEEGKNYKYWGNNVYSMTLPKPQHREFNEICIEHLYQDDVIKRWIVENNNQRRIFMGDEFDENGIYLGKDMCLLCCDKNACKKNSIIDGGKNKKVIEPYGDDRSRNYALSKTEFADRILNKSSPFESVNFEGFVPLFELLEVILQNEQDDTSV